MLETQAELGSKSNHPCWEKTLFQQQQLLEMKLHQTICNNFYATKQHSTIIWCYKTFLEEI